MEFFRIKKDIPFMRHALVFNIISLITFLLAVFFLLFRGLHLSVEFTGGTLIEVNYAQAADLEKIRQGLVKAGNTDVSVQNYGSSQDVMIRLPLKGETNSTKIGEAVMSTLDAEAPGATLRRVEFVGPQVGRELAENGSMALFLVVVGIVIYLAGKPYIKSLEHLPQMAEASIKMVSGSIDAFINKDLALARDIIEMDDVIDDLFDTIKSELIDLIRHDPDNGE